MNGPTANHGGGAGAATALVVLGVALVGGAVAHGVEYGTTEVEVLVVAAPGALLLCGLGYVLWSSLHAATYRTIARWVFGGLLTFGGGVAGVLFLAPDSQLPTSSATFATLFFAGLGAVGGLLVGIKSVQAVDQARRAEEARTSALLFAAERDRLSQLSETSHDLITVTDEWEACRRLASGIEAAFTESSCAVWLVDRTGDLAPCDERMPGAPGRAGEEAFRTGEERMVETGDSGTSLLVPLADRGLLSVTLPSKRAFGERTRDLVRVYARSGESALERIDQQRALERQNERLEEFASVVSHDLRSPLSVIEGRARLALETGELDHVEHIVDNVDRMDRLVDDLLTLAREGEGATERRPVKVTRLVDDAWDSVDTPQATLETTADLPVLEVDPAQFRRVFENLFRNAVEHGGGDVTVRVTSFIEGDHHGVAVEDDGTGIAPEDRSTVFERGFTTGGNGLGLAIVDEIVRAHGGTVVAREAETGGARFEIRDVDPDRETIDRVDAAT